MSKLLPVISRGMLPPWANAPHQILTPAAETAPKVLALAITPPSSPRAPPAHVFHLLPLLHLGEVVVGDLHPGPRRPSPPLDVAPSPVLLPIYSNPSHLPPPVHKNLPSEVGNIDPLRDLPVQAVGMDPSHSHIISHIGSVVVVI